MPNLIQQSDSKNSPSNTGLSASTLAKVLERLRDDPEWFFERALKISDKSGKLTPFTPNPQQRIVLNIMRAFRRAELPVRIIILKARQIGISTLCEGLVFHKSVLWSNQTARVIADRYETTDHLFDISRRFYREMPEDPLLKPKTENLERKGIVFAPPHNSAIRIDTAGQQYAGTGHTIQFGHFSEIAKWPNPGVVATSLMQAIPYLPWTDVIFESTANGIGDYFHEVWLKAVDKNGTVTDKLVALAAENKLDEMVKILKNTAVEGFIPLFFPWHEFAEYADPLYEGEKLSLTPEERALTKDFRLTPEQIKFRRRKIAELAEEEGIRPEDWFAQEYPLTPDEAFISTGSTVFDKAALRTLKKGKEIARYNVLGSDKPFKYEEYTKENRTEDGTILPLLSDDAYGALRVYKTPEKDEEYVVGGDVAEGMAGQDFSVLEIFNKKTLEQCAEWHGYIEPAVFGRISAMLGAWYNEAEVIVEINGPGHAVLPELVENIGYENVFVRGGSYRSTKEAPANEWGWKTDQQTKPMIIGLMARHIREGTVTLNSPGLIEECRQYKIDEKGRYTAPEGKHDDRVMATAIALQGAFEHPYVPPMPDHIKEAYDERELEDVLEPDPNRHLEEVT